MQMDGRGRRPANDEWMDESMDLSEALRLISRSIKVERKAFPVVFFFLLIQLGIPSSGGRAVNVLATIGGSSSSSIFDTSFLKNNPAVVVRRKRPLTVITPRQQQQQQQQKQRRRSVVVPQQQRQPIFSSVPAVPRPTILASRQRFEAPSTPRFTVVRRRRPPRPSAAVLERRRQQILSSGARSVSDATRQKPRFDSLADGGAVQSSDPRSSNPSIFETPDGRFFLISNERQEFRDEQFFQTPDGRFFRISAMEGKEAEAVGAALRNETPEPAPPAEKEEDEEEDRLALILDKIRSRAKAEKAREKAEAAARVRQEAAEAAERRRPQLSPTETEASAAPAREGRPRSSSNLPRRSNNVASLSSSSSSSVIQQEVPLPVTGSPSIFRTSDGKLFVISSSGNEFDDDQYFQTPDGRLFRISAMNDDDIAHDTEVDDAAAREPAELALGIGDAGPFAVADALRKNKEDPLPGYNAAAAAAPVTSVTSSVSSVVSMESVSGADTQAADDNRVGVVGVDGSEDDDAVIVAARDNSNNRGATSESATDGDIPVFIQRQPLFSSNQIFGRGSTPKDDQPAQKHLLIRTANGNALIIPQQFVTQTVTQSELRGLLGLPEQQHLQQRGVLLFDGSGNAFQLEI